MPLERLKASPKRKRQGFLIVSIIASVLLAVILTGCSSPRRENGIQDQAKSEQNAILNKTPNPHKRPSPSVTQSSSPYEISQSDIEKAEAFLKIGATYENYQKIFIEESYTDAIKSLGRDWT